eukprot:Skav221298  [mRNA]  locus=scaffold1920:331528:333771:- [translate_table: standard]
MAAALAMGQVYRGQFCEDCMSGEGRMQWRDGVEYIGQFVANKREGYGTMTWMSGRWKKYAGQWKDGMQNEVGRAGWDYVGLRVQSQP